MHFEPPCLVPSASRLHLERADRVVSRWYSFFLLCRAIQVAECVHVVSNRSSRDRAVSFSFLLYAK